MPTQSSAGHCERIGNATHCYVGMATCGCRVFVVVDCGDKDTAKSVSQVMRRGLTIERETIEHFRAAEFGHKCGKRS